MSYAGLYGSCQSTYLEAGVLLIDEPLRNLDAKIKSVSGEKTMIKVIGEEIEFHNFAVAKPGDSAYGMGSKRRIVVSLMLLLEMTTI